MQLQQGNQFREFLRKFSKFLMIVTIPLFTSASCKSALLNCHCLWLLMSKIFGEPKVLIFTLSVSYVVIHPKLYIIRSALLLVIGHCYWFLSLSRLHGVLSIIIRMLDRKSKDVLCVSSHTGDLAPPVFTIFSLDGWHTHSLNNKQI